MSELEMAKSLVENHLDYVIKIARGIARTLPPYVEFDELVAWGNLGLAQAAERWDAGSGAAFTTFAWYRIRGSVFDGLCQMTGLPPAILKRVKHFALEDSWAEETLRSSDGSAGLQALTSSFSRAVEGFAIVHFSAGHEDQAVDPKEDAAADVEQTELFDMLRAARHDLPEEDQRLLEALYVQGLTTTAYAKSLGVNKSTVARRHARILNRLRLAILDSDEVDALESSAGPTRLERLA